jgi:hypothetical protein
MGWEREYILHLSRRMHCADGSRVHGMSMYFRVD